MFFFFFFVTERGFNGCGNPCREDQPAASCVRAMQELSHLAEEFHNGCPVLDLKIADMEYIERNVKKRKLEEALKSYSCPHCPQFEEHV